MRDPAKVEELFGAPLLGAIPEAESESPLDELADRKSPIHEAWLAMRSNLELLTGDGVPASLLVTSTMPNEGKSHAAIAIARLLAMGTCDLMMLVSSHRFYD